MVTSQDVKDAERTKYHVKRYSLCFPIMRFIVRLIIAVWVLFPVFRIPWPMLIYSGTILLLNLIIHFYFFLGFSEMTECEKNDLVCPTGKVCKTNKGDYWCACKDGYEEIVHGAGDATCKGRKFMSR